MIALEGRSSSSRQLSLNPNESQDVKEAGTGAFLESKRQQHALQAAEQTFDGLLASLFSSMDNHSDQEEAAHRLLTLGNTLLTTHRRLSEDATDASTSPHAEVEAHLARRLSDYSFEIFYTPHKPSTIADVNTLVYSPMTTTTNNGPVLGMGSSHIDSCLYSQYRNGDLIATTSNTCRVALDWFELARQTPGLMFHEVVDVHRSPFHPEGKEEEQERLLDSPIFRGMTRSFQDHLYPSSTSTTDSTTSMDDYASSLSILVGIYALIAFVGLCTGLIDVWTFVVGMLISGLVATCGVWIVVVILPVTLLVDRLLCCGVEDDDEGEDEREEDVDAQCDYVKLSDDDGDDEVEGRDGTMKQAKALVFVGVPVQVV
jgi:uncharacterized membrane protein